MYRAVVFCLRRSGVVGLGTVLLAGQRHWFLHAILAGFCAGRCHGVVPGRATIVIAASVLRRPDPAGGRFLFHVTEQSAAGRGSDDSWNRDHSFVWSLFRFLWGERPLLPARRSPLDWFWHRIALRFGRHAGRHVCLRNYSRSLDVSTTAWGIIVASSVLGIALGHYFLYSAVSRLGAAVTSGAHTLTPFPTMLLAGWLLHERLTGLEWCAGLTMVAGAAVLLYAQHRLVTIGQQPTARQQPGSGNAKPAIAPSETDLTRHQDLIVLAQAYPGRGPPAADADLDCGAARLVGACRITSMIRRKVGPACRAGPGNGCR